MAKSRRGEHIVIGAIGGSITEGALASITDMRYINQVYSWWEKKFPGQVSVVNAGIGATCSGFGAHRVELQLLTVNPDLVIIDYAVNDTLIPNDCNKTMEGLIRKILSKPNNPAIMIIFFMLNDYSNLQDKFIPICYYYNLPGVSYRDRIKGLVDTGTITLDSLFADIVHPNDYGHTYAADFIKEVLDSVWNSLPLDAEIPQLKTSLSSPFYTDTFQYTSYYNNSTIAPVKVGEWANGSFSGLGYGWIGNTPGNELVFDLPACTGVSVLIKKELNADMGISDMWVDNGVLKTIDSYYFESSGWPGPFRNFHIIGENLPFTDHVLHVSIRPDKNPAISGNTSHLFELINVFADGVPH